MAKKMSQIQFFYRYLPKSVTVPQPSVTVPQKYFFLHTMGDYYVFYLPFRVALLFPLLKNTVTLTVTVTVSNLKSVPVTVTFAVR